MDIDRAVRIYTGLADLKVELETEMKKQMSQDLKQSHVI